MKKTITLLTVVALMLTVFVGCNQATPNNSDTIKVGINYELSGGTATYGQSSVEGIELAIEEINKAGGINGNVQGNDPGGGTEQDSRCVGIRYGQ